MATQEKNSNMALMTMDEALAEFDAELSRLEQEQRDLDEHINSGRSAMGISFYR